jgi:hypothetical protein
MSNKETCEMQSHCSVLSCHRCGARLMRVLRSNIFRRSLPQVCSFLTNRCHLKMKQERKRFIITCPSLSLPIWLGCLCKTCRTQTHSGSFCLHWGAEPAEPSNEGRDTQLMLRNMARIEQEYHPAYAIRRNLET